MERTAYSKIGLPKLGSFDWNVLGHYLEPAVARVGHGHAEEQASVLVELVLMGLSVAVAGFGIYLAWRFYGNPRGEARAMHGLRTRLRLVFDGLLDVIGGDQVKRLVGKRHSPALRRRDLDGRQERVRILRQLVRPGN